MAAVVAKAKVVAMAEDAETITCVAITEHVTTVTTTTADLIEEALMLLLMVTRECDHCLQLPDPADIIHHPCLTAWLLRHPSKE